MMTTRNDALIRGQESAGIVTCKYKTEPFKVARAEGLVSQAFSEMSMMSLKGNLGVGHTRYSTSGAKGSIQLAQPFVVHTSYGTISIAHNGELVNSEKLRETLLSHGVGLTTGVDSELITQCMSQPPPDEFRHPRFRNRRNSSSSTANAEMAAVAAAACSDPSSAGKQRARAPSFSGPASGSTTGNGHTSNNGYSSGTRCASANGASSCPTNLQLPIWKTDLNVDEDNLTARLLHLMSITPISYSLIIMYNECLYASRDAFGNRPLTIGMLMPPPNAGDIGSIPFSIVDNCFTEGWVVSSESCSFPSIHAKLKRDVNPGEIIKFERNKLPKTLAYMPRPGFAEAPAFCIFEYVYFARPDSIMETQTVYSVRKKCGQQLALESAPLLESTLSTGDTTTKDQFIVAPVPESAIPAALGFAQQTGLPYVEVFCKNRYVGRTFIQPSTRLRRLGVAKKFGPLTENFVGKCIILIDDSIVRGTTIGQLVRLLREAGAKQVHIRIASPPLHYPCYMGINIPTREELIANHLSAEQLALSLGAASLKYLSVEGLRKSVQDGIKANIIADKQRVRMPQVGDPSGPGIVDISRVPQAEAEAALVSALPVGASNTESSFTSASNNAELEAEFRRKIGHCDACLTGKYPVQLDVDSSF